ncbi:MAG: FUSC family protein [Myxococcaceae bacterium]
MNPVLAHPLSIALKASLSALAASLLVELLGMNDRLSATFVAVVCISPTVYTGLRRGLEQIAASTLGGVVTWLLTLVLPLPRPVALVAALFITIWLCFRVGFGRAFLVGAFTVLYVLLIPGATIGATLSHRLASVAIGVACATALNVIVSFATYRSVFARRQRIARERVGSSFIALAELLRKGETSSTVFEDVFPLLRALLDELCDAVRESRLRVASKSRARLTEMQHAVEELLAVAHHGKDLVLLLRRQPQPFPLAAEWSRHLGEALIQGRASNPQRSSEPLAREALARASEAAALAAEPSGRSPHETKFRI